MSKRHGAMSQHNTRINVDWVSGSVISHRGQIFYILYNASPVNMFKNKVDTSKTGG